jgi:predicted nucleic acid-binding protein
MNVEHFVDTNILVYAHDKSAGRRHEIAKALVSTLWEQKNAAISTQVLQEFYATVSKNVLNPGDSKTARRWLTNYLQWQVIDNDGASVLRAIDIEQRHQLSFWDAMIVQAAILSGAKTLFSEDLNNGQKYGRVTVQDPFQ